jgi:dTDP-4-amino-4,6-dideoxygalactose transaminase
MNFNIVFNRIDIVGNEMKYMEQAITAGRISGNGPFTIKAQTFLEEQLGVKKALLATSCTHAIEMAAILFDTQPGDEVICPSFTFVSTINPFILRGARPVFIDIRPDTLNMDETGLERLITKRTRTILPVHYAGVACEMDAIMDIAQRHRLPVMEDNAHALFAKYKGRYLGTFGAMATQSFHETKNFSCGEGGALLFNDPQYIERAEILREKGTDRSKFFRGQVDKYSWVDIGSSYIPSDILAAFLYGQFEQHLAIQNKRKQIWEIYYQGLKAWAERHDVHLPYVPDHVEQSYHMFYLLMPTLELRQKLIAHLKEKGILSVFHYVPLHLSTMGKKFGGKPGDCPNTESISDRLLRLPFFYSLSEADQDNVMENIVDFKF